MHGTKKLYISTGKTASDLLGCSPVLVFRWSHVHSTQLHYLASYGYESVGPAWNEVSLYLCLCVRPSVFSMCGVCVCVGSNGSSCHIVEFILFSSSRDCFQTATKRTRDAERPSETPMDFASTVLEGHSLGLSYQSFLFVLYSCPDSLIGARSQ